MSPRDDSQAPSGYYRRLGAARFESTIHAQGAWAADHQHMAPVSGLLTRAIEECSPREDLMISRIAFDILGVIPTGIVDVEARVIRRGRTVELVEAELHAAGRVAVRATAWRLAISDTGPIAGSPFDLLPGPAAGAPWRGAGVWGGGFIRSLEFRVLPGWQPGRGQVWLHSDVDMVAGEVTSPLSGFIGLLDTANGIALRADPHTLLFPNTDLTIHLFRQPVGEWAGLDTSVTFGPDGVGLTATTLHDVTGPVGRAAQTLTLRPVGSLDEVRVPIATPFAG